MPSHLTTAGAPMTGTADTPPLSQALAKPKIMPLKSVTLEKIEAMEREAAARALHPVQRARAAPRHRRARLMAPTRPAARKQVLSEKLAQQAATGPKPQPKKQA